MGTQQQQHPRPAEGARDHSLLAPMFVPASVPKHGPVDILLHAAVVAGVWAAKKGLGFWLQLRKRRRSQASPASLLPQQDFTTTNICLSAHKLRHYTPSDKRFRQPLDVAFPALLELAVQVKWPICKYGPGSQYYSAFDHDRQQHSNDDIPCMPEQCQLHVQQFLFSGALRICETLAVLDLSGLPYFTLSQFERSPEKSLACCKYYSFASRATYARATYLPWQRISLLLPPRLQALILPAARLKQNPDKFMPQPSDEPWLRLGPFAALMNLSEQASPLLMVSISVILDAPAGQGQVEQITCSADELVDELPRQLRTSFPLWLGPFVSMIERQLGRDQDEGGIGSVLSVLPAYPGWSGEAAHEFLRFIDSQYREDTER